jgi:heat shock protein HtpX
MISNRFSYSDSVLNPTLSAGSFYPAVIFKKFDKMRKLLKGYLRKNVWITIFGASGYIVKVVILYFVTVAISMSPLGEYLTALFTDAKEIKRTDVKLRMVPLVQYVLDCAKENSRYHLDSVKGMIIYDPVPNG